MPPRCQNCGRKRFHTSLYEHVSLCSEVSVGRLILRFYRERNREHAKRSRVRKKFLLESLQKSVSALQEENEKLRGAIRANLDPDEATDLLAQTEASSLIASNPGDATKVSV